MIYRFPEKGELAALLRAAGAELDLGCGGKGTCGRCRVKLLSGRWETGGREVTPPCDVPACRTRLLAGPGSVEFTPPSEPRQIATLWDSRPLPCREELIVGIDIGTTTLAAVAVQKGKVVSRAGCFNAQSRFGADVASRISAAAGDLRGLQQAVRDSVMQLLQQLGAGEAARIGVAGNTVMCSLFHGIDPAPIGRAPFRPSCTHFPETELAGIPLFTVPAIGGYIGGDITAGLGEISLQPGEMLIDIGTNCEMVLHTGEELLGTAAPAGPAFEGGGLRSGGRASEGAVDHVFPDGSCTVLGGTVPRCICGSGWIDLLAAGRQAGWLDESGRFPAGMKEKTVAGELAVTEEEIATLIMAKAAIGAGICTLEKYASCRARKIWLAGGFSRYLDCESAIRIGLLPHREFVRVGNTSLGGATRLAADPAEGEELLKIAGGVRELSLNALPGFEDSFLEAMRLAPLEIQ